MRSHRATRTEQTANEIVVDPLGNAYVNGADFGRVELGENRAPFALMLGGPDRRTLFICTAEWHKADGAPANLERLTAGPRTGQILTLPVEVPGAERVRQ